MTTPNCLSQIYVLLINVPTSQCSVLPPDVGVVGCRWRQFSVPGNASTVGRRSRSDRHHRRLDWVHEQRDNHCLAAAYTRRAGTSIDPVNEFQEEDYYGKDVGPGPISISLIASAGMGHHKPGSFYGSMVHSFIFEANTTISKTPCALAWCAQMTLCQFCKRLRNRVGNLGAMS